MEIFLLLLSIGTCMIGFKIGTENGRKETLDDFTRRINLGLEHSTDFHSKFGVRGMFLVLDYFGGNSSLGTGYSPNGPTPDFVVVHREDLFNILDRSKRYEHVHHDDDSADHGDVESADTFPITQSQLVDIRKFKPSLQLAEIVGPTLLTRSDVLQKLLQYIQSNGLQTQEGGRMIKCDDKLRAIAGESETTFFALTSRINNHLTLFP
jgi:hypothetical protein